jgi:SAM-dependent methyltransferase
MRSRHLHRGDPLAEPAAQRTEPDDWSGYYRMTDGRAVRPLFAKGMAAVAASGQAPGLAVELGFGDGTESAALLAAGWRVVAIDPTAAAADLLRAKVPAELADHLEIVTLDAEEAMLPDFDLLYAGYALSFVHPTGFPAVWRSIREHLRPGGHLVVNVFGVRDTWAADPEMTFVDAAAARALVDGLEVVAFDEEDADGPSGSGPKHWHLFDLVARRPFEAPQ